MDIAVVNMAILWRESRRFSVVSWSRNDLRNIISVSKQKTNFLSGERQGEDKERYVCSTRSGKLSKQDWKKRIFVRIDHPYTPCEGLKNIKKNKHLPVSSKHLITNSKYLSPWFNQVCNKKLYIHLRVRSSSISLIPLLYWRLQSLQ